MPDLVTLAEFKDHLSYKKTDLDTLLTAILDAAEDHLENETGQVFAGSGTVTDEARLGRGTNVLYLRRPASSITTIKVSALGNVASPDYTIPTADVLLDPENGRRLIRVQNGVFPTARRNVFNVFVTYAAAANLPNVAKEAVKERGELWYRRRGREHVQSESLGDLGSQTLFTGFERGPRWDAAIAALRTSVAA